MKKYLFLFIMICVLPFYLLAQQIDAQIDTIHYHLPYRDSTIGANYSEGYIDTFSVANSHFRLIHNDTVFDAIVEKNINGVWIQCLESLDMGNHNDYALIDINGDGYNDFVHYLKWYGEVYFFDTVLNNFLNVSTANTEWEWKLIDSTNNIFCDFQQGKLFKGQIHSSLFTYYKGFYQKELYDLELDNNKTDSLVTGLILYKNYFDFDDLKYTPTKQEEIQRIKFEKPINVFEKEYDFFDYVKFWKEHYKKLLDLK